MKTKPCKYCNKVELYWDDGIGRYCEVESGEPHRCDSYVKGAATSSNKPRWEPRTKPDYSSAKPKEKENGSNKNVDNSFELLTGSVDEIRKEYQYLSKLVKEHSGKVHGSQSSFIEGIGELRLIVYYEVAEGHLDPVQTLLKRLRDG